MLIVDCCCLDSNTTEYSDDSFAETLEPERRQDQCKCATITCAEDTEDKKQEKKTWNGQCLLTLTHQRVSHWKNERFGVPEVVVFVVVVWDPPRPQAFIVACGRPSFVACATGHMAHHFFLRLLLVSIIDTLHRLQLFLRQFWDKDR